MKVVLTSGHPHSGFNLVQAILEDAGLAAALPSRWEKMPAAEIQARLLKASGASAHSYDHPVTPGRLWQELAVDLFLGNLNIESWGWADAGTVPLLDFWRDFDAQVRFVLVYAPPEFAVSQALSGQPATKEAIDAALAGWTDCNNLLLRYFLRNKERCELVNLTGALHAPAELTRLLGERWSLQLELPAAYTPRRTGLSAVAAALIRGAVHGRHDVLSLYTELESAATLNGAGSDAEELQAWHEYGAEKTAQAATLSQVEQLKQELAAVTAERQAQIEQLKKQLAEQPKAPANGHSPKLEELKQENELLLLQLHQVQEELEHYYLKNQELLKKSTGESYLLHFLRDNQPSEVVVDLRGEIDGQNWYHAEEDGRWAGPAKTSELRIPALIAGKYTLEIDVVDAMSRAILEGMTIAVNGTPVPTRTPMDEGFPTIVQGQFDAQQIAAAPTWKISLGFKEVMSPAQRGEGDDRKLAVRVKTVTLILDEPAVPAQ